jgi:hypothetical protein
LYLPSLRWRCCQHLAAVFSVVALAPVTLAALVLHSAFGWHLSVNAPMLLPAFGCVLCCPIDGIVAVVLLASLPLFLWCHCPSRTGISAFILLALLF